MRIDVGRVVAIMEEIAEINRVPLEDLEIFEDGVRIEVPADKVQRWLYMGLNNSWAIRDRFWELEWERCGDVASNDVSVGG